MKFTDYPKDLQRIVELTPEGWPQGCTANRIAVDPDGEIRFDNAEVWADFRTHTDCSDVVDDLAWISINKGHTRDQYNQCRAQWLAEKAEVDWRGLCEELFEALDMTYGMSYLHPSQEPVVKTAIDKARKALEKQP